MSGSRLLSLFPKTFTKPKTFHRIVSEVQLLLLLLIFVGGDMAKREEEMKEIKTKTTEEISEEVVGLKGELFMLRLQKSARDEFTSSEFRRMRKRLIWGCLIKDTNTALEE